MSAIPLKREVEYPSSDGKPMAETDLHRDEMFYVIEGLRTHFREEPGVYVSGNILLYYVEGNPRASISPDALVAKGLQHAKELRDIYKVWEEGRPPCWVMEVTSKKTNDEDLDRKWKLYARLGVEEYFLFDPRDEYLEPPLQAFRLAGGSYQSMPAAPDGSVTSPLLGIVFQRREDGRLLMTDLRTGEVLLRPEEVQGAREEERAARRAAEARAAFLEEELARLRRELESGKQGNR